MVVTGLSVDTTYQDIEALFKPVGQVEKSALVVGGDGKPTGKAYVVYSTVDAVPNAVAHLSKEEVLVNPITAADRQEFRALLPEESAADQLLRALQALPPEELAKIFAKLMPQQLPVPVKPEDTSLQHKSDVAGAADFSKARNPSPVTIKPDPHAMAQPPSAGVSHGSGAFRYGDGPVIIHEQPKLTSFSGSGRECSFGRWKYEVTCLLEDQNYSASAISRAVHNSLKSPAADVLGHLGSRATVTEIILKLESIYGSVQSEETLMEHFYSERQRPKKENCAAWSCRLEDLVFQAASKGAIDRSDIPIRLKKRFWSGLKDRQIKDALRNRVDSLTFEELLREARALEEEYDPEHRTGSEGIVHQVTEADSKFDELLKRMAKMEAKIDQLQQPQKQKSNKQSSKDDSKVVCSKCEQEGHLPFGCRKGKDVTCYRCNQAGHISKACRNPRKVSNME